MSKDKEFFSKKEVIKLCLEQCLKVRVETSVHYILRDFLKGWIDIDLASQELANLKADGLTTEWLKQIIGTQKHIQTALKEGKLTFKPTANLQDVFDTLLNSFERRKSRLKKRSRIKKKTF